MKKKLLGLLLTIPLFVTGCATWGAADSFEAGRLGAQTLEEVAALTCDQDPGKLTTEQRMHCDRFKAANVGLGNAIDMFEDAWNDLAPVLGISEPEKVKVPKHGDAEESDETE